MNLYSENHYPQRLWKPMFKICMGMWLLMVAEGNCLAYEFTIEGEIRMRDYYEGELAAETNYNFRVEVRDCNSRIRVFGGYYNPVEFHEYGWDGTNSYMLVKFWTNRTSSLVQLDDDGPIRLNIKSSAAKTVKPVNDAVLSIVLDDLPQNGHGMEPIWLAYGSRCHYNARTSDTKVESVWYMGPEVEGHKQMFRSSWTMNESFPGLLGGMIDFFNEVPAITNSVYSVTSWTNVSGMNLPRIFQVVHDRPSSSPLLYRVYEGVAHSIRPTCSVVDFFPNNIPDSTPTSVFDKRLSQNNGPVSTITYLSKTGEVIQDLDRLKKTKAYVNAKVQDQIVARTETKAVATPTRWRPIMIGFFLVASLFPIWVLVKVTRKPNTQNNNEKEKIP